MTHFVFSSAILLIIIKIIATAKCKMIMPNLERVTVIQAFFENDLIKLWKVQNSSFSVSDIGFCCSINHHKRWQFRSYDSEFLQIYSLNCCSDKQPPNVFCTNHVLKNFTKFKWKHLCQSLFLIKACNFIKRRLQHRGFPVNFVKFLRTPFIIEDVRGCFCTEHFTSNI